MASQLSDAAKIAVARVTQALRDQANDCAKEAEQLNTDAVDELAQIFLDYLRPGKGMLPDMERRGKEQYDGQETDESDEDQASVSSYHEDEDEDDDDDGNDGEDDDDEPDSTDSDEPMVSDGEEVTGDDNPEVTVGGQTTTAVSWLKSLKPHIETFQKPDPVTTCPGLLVKPRDYQLDAVASIEYHAATPYKGVVVAYPPGLGKTFIATMAIVKAAPTAERYTIVVVPPSVVAQWLSEFEKFFEPDTVKVFLLDDPMTPFMELLKYDVIVVTYNFVVKRYTQREDYLDTIAEIKKKGIADPKEFPRRPNLALLADYIKHSSDKSPYIVLDEAHLIKNPGSITYKAIAFLRKTAKTCIMLTGTPLDNTWIDSYALATLMLDQPLTSRGITYRIFSEQDKSHSTRRIAPRGNLATRFINFLKSFMIRLPETVLDIPPLTTETVDVVLSAGEKAQSDDAFHRYDQAKKAGKNTLQLARRGKKGQRRRFRGQTSNSMTDWSALTKAMQCAYHEALPEIMLYTRGEGVATKGSVEDLEKFQSSKHAKEWEKWRDNLKENDAWRSSRIMALISVFNKQRDLDPDCKVLIFDESIYFLDIVDIAFSQMHDPIQCHKFNGRLSSEGRKLVLKQFVDAPAPAVMLITRGVGGLGLNLTMANVVILCGVQWKQSWEIQAVKRAHRSGQLRPVTEIRLASNALVEMKRSKLRNRKHAHNDKMMKELEKQKLTEITEEE